MNPIRSVTFQLTKTYVVQSNVEEKNYLQIRAASTQNDFMGLQILPLGRQCAIDQRTTLEQGIEHADQRALMVVPAQTKMLVVSRHAYHSPIRKNVKNKQGCGINGGN